METIGVPTKTLEIASWDIYYSEEKNNDSFLRFRNSNTPELTKKVKTVNNNNWIRTEIDLPLRSMVSEETVTKFVNLLGYKENFRIYKACFIYWFCDVNYVYYTVFNDNLKELGRFIEVEVNKSAVNSGSIYILNNRENILSGLGITAQNRLKKSLFELYRKD